MIQFYRVKLKCQGKFGENTLFPELTCTASLGTKLKAICQGGISRMRNTAFLSGPMLSQRFRNR